MTSLTNNSDNPPAVLPRRSSQAPRYLWKSPNVTSGFRTAVSLHSHTQHSKEALSFVPRYAHRVPVLTELVRRQEEKYDRMMGKPVDYSKAWWTPPLPSREAFDVERKQIHGKLGLQAMVSLTDHDDIEACTLLQVLEESCGIPISVEWTVPFGPSFFHMGVHNLPPRDAAPIMAQLAGYTRNPRQETLAGIFAALSETPSVLIVFNHPLWDEPAVGAAVHNPLVHRFLSLYKNWIHALELNGLRSWNENYGVIDLAVHWDIPCISGGDRHALEPNAIVNLTNASTFDEFAAEVRRDHYSQVLFMNHYREPMRLRLMQNLLDVVREYEDHPEGRRSWRDRVFFETPTGEVKSLSSVWVDDGPRIVQLFMGSIRLLESRWVRNSLRFALANREEVPA